MRARSDERRAVREVDGRSVTELSPGGVRLFITNRSPGSQVELTVLREGARITNTIKLVEP